MFQKASWSGDINQASRKLEVIIQYIDGNNKVIHNIPLGSMLLLRSDSKELFRGIVFSVNRDTSNSATITAYDHLIYLLKSNATVVCKKGSLDTASKIIKKICKDYEIPIGEIVETDVILKSIYRDQTLYDICISALTETTKRNKKKYIMAMKDGKLTVKEKSKQTIMWRIESNTNLIDGSYQESIEEMKNKIVITGDKDNVIATLQDDVLIKQFGILQQQQSEGSNIRKSEVMAVARNLLSELGKIGKEADINAIGIDEVIAGSAIDMSVISLGLTGTFYVATDEHSFENGSHTMSLKLNWTDEVASAQVQDNGDS